jgi:choline dehydrogenase
VLLLEAGSNFAPNGYPPGTHQRQHRRRLARLRLGYHTDDAPRLGLNIAVPQGRVIGSAVDAAVAMRARPADFARWAKRGIEGWSWDEARAPLVSSTVVGMADAIATGRTSDVAAARSQAEAALGAYWTDEGEQSEKSS